MEQSWDYELPFGAATRNSICAGDADALAFGVVCVAACLLAEAGVSARVCDFELQRSSIVAQEDKAKAALAASAMDVIEVLRLSPIGQKAIAQFLSKPGP